LRATLFRKLRDNVVGYADFMSQFFTIGKKFFVNKRPYAERNISTG